MTVVMSDMALGVRLMGYGLAGTFGVLLAFIGIIKLLVWLFPDKKREKNT